MLTCWPNPTHPLTLYLIGGPVCPPSQLYQQLSQTQPHLQIQTPHPQKYVIPP